MGTRGYYGYRRRGRYAIMYVQYDSYPESLGMKLIRDIPKDPEAFAQWLSGLKEWFDKNWEEEHAITLGRQQIPSEIRFELLSTSPTDATPATMTTDITRQKKDLRYEWLWSDFPPFWSQWDTEWSYIYDLDNDAFTVNSTDHFRMSNMPTGFVEYLSCTTRGPPEKKLEDEHVAKEAVNGKPEIQQDLLRSYLSTRVSITEAPTIENHPAHLMLLDLLRGLSLLQEDPEFRLRWNSWLPTDLQMQRLAYTMVRHAMWDGLTWITAKEAGIKKVFPWRTLEHMPQTITMPTTPQYYIFAGTRKILISLARGLDEEDIVKMEVARVIDLIPLGTVQEACIISLCAVIIVNVDKSSSPILVSHTPELRFNSDQEEGWEALIATLTPIERYSTTFAYKNLILPPEIVDHIFKDVFLTTDRNTLTNFALVSKSFSKLVRHRTVKIGRRLLLASSIEQGYLFYGFDEKGKMQLFNVSGYPDFEFVEERVSFYALADGVNLGFSETLVSIVKKRRVPGGISDLPDAEGGETSEGESNGSGETISNHSSGVGSPENSIDE